MKSIQNQVLHPVILAVPATINDLKPKERVRFLSQHARRALALSAEKSRITLGELAQALTHYGQALDILREVEDRRWEARTLHNVGYAYYVLGEPQRALSFLREALALREEIGDRRGQSLTLNNLGRVERSAQNRWRVNELVLEQDIGEWSSI